MRSPCRNRRRFSKRFQPRRTAVIALVLTVLMSFQIATTTVARLLWPAHTHTVLNTQPRAADVDSSCQPSGACAGENDVFPAADRLSSSLERPSTARTGKYDHATTLAHIPMLPRQDHLRQWLVHADAHLPIRTRRQTPPAETRAGDDDSAGSEHAHIKALTHALAHAAGVGHHRHAFHTIGVVYVDDDQQLPTTLLIRYSDMSLLLPSAQLLLPVPNRATAAPPGPPSVPLIALYALPGERPPR